MSLVGLQDLGRLRPGLPEDGWRARRGRRVDDAMPVAGVTLAEARAWCARAGGRLPTGDEWEAAARGLPDARGVVRRWPWGDEDLPAGSRPPANVKDRSFVERVGVQHPLVPWDDGAVLAVPADAFPDGAAACGALQLVGNVAEWVESGGAEEVRGGGFCDSLDYALPQRPQLDRSEDRGRSEHIGFRLALDEP